MKKIKLSVVTLMMFIPMMGASLTILGNPVVVDAQSDGTGYYEELYIWNHLPKSLKKQYDELQRKQGRCIIHAIYQAVAFKGLSWDAAIQALYNAGGSCSILG